ncbi:MAG: flavin reductase family protein [Saprospiraceae bacterium]|nr:flavin reductase family protein [Saprospiraceae bacterium]
MLTINPKEVSIPVLHHYLQCAVAPRPIAFASTIDKEGNVNLSPFSFFNVFGTNPPTLIFSPNRRVRDGSNKHTLENVLEHDEVVINMVDYDMVEQMSLASCEYEKGVNEFKKAGFTEGVSVMVKPPRVMESKAVFECKVKQVIQMSEEGGSPNLVICEVILAHFSEDILNEKGMVDQTKTDWVARLGGDWYCRASGKALFEVPKPSIHKGIGIDALPDFIKHDKSLTGNDLGRLGNLEKLPTQTEIDTFLKENPSKNYKKLGKFLLKNGKIKEALLVFLCDK